MLSEIIQSLPTNLRAGESERKFFCIKRSRTRYVLRIEKAGTEWGADAGKTLYLKRYLNPYWRRKLGSLLGISKARSEANILKRLAERGIVVPRVIEFLTRWDASYIVTESLRNTTTLADALSQSPQKERAAIWELVGQYTAELWRHGIYHPDYFQDHMLLNRATTTPSDPDSRPLLERFALLDVDGVILRAKGTIPPLNRRIVTAFQLLKSVDKKLGSSDERKTFLKAAFECDLETLEQTIIPRIEKVASDRNSETGLSVQ